MAILKSSFFDRDACEVARSLIGKVIRRNYRGHWLAARIIETEAYYIHDRASHASLGFTQKRRGLFMPAGTIYMYYARGKDSLNVSCHGDGNAVLIKSAYPIEDAHTDSDAIRIMQSLNPAASGEPRPIEKLCRGQTLLCHALDIRLTDWDQKPFDPAQLYIDDSGDRPEHIIQTTRLGIPDGRDGHLPYRYVDFTYATFCTRNPLSRRGAIEGRDYHII